MVLGVYSRRYGVGAPTPFPGARSAAIPFPGGTLTVRCGGFVFYSLVGSDSFSARYSWVQVISRWNVAVRYGVGLSPVGAGSS